MEFNLYNTDCSFLGRYISKSYVAKLTSEFKIRIIKQDEKNKCMMATIIIETLEDLKRISELVSEENREKRELIINFENNFIEIYDDYRE